MKRNLLKSLLALALVLVCGNVWGETFKLASANEVELNDITVSFGQGSGSSAPAWFSAGLRLYANNTVTISSKSNITAITFNWEKQAQRLLLRPRLARAHTLIPLLQV